METQTSAKQPLWMAGLITQSMSGRPASGLMFFLGMDTEPPRAGIIAMTRGLAVAILLVRAVAMANCSSRFQRTTVAKNLSFGAWSAQPVPASPRPPRAAHSRVCEQV